VTAVGAACDMDRAAHAFRLEFYLAFVGDFFEVELFEMLGEVVVFERCILFDLVGLLVSGQC
jgi:hypothetical protein